MGVVLVWAATGPIFGFSDRWQLIINTSTTIVMTDGELASLQKEFERLHDNARVRGRNGRRGKQRGSQSHR